MNRPVHLIAALLCCLTWEARAQAPTGAPTSSPSAAPSSSAKASADQGTPPAPPPESLRDLRLQVARGKLAGSAALCDRLAAGYAALRDTELARKDRQGYLDSSMACYCLYAKAQVLTLKGDYSGAGVALQEAAAYRAQHAETALKSLAKIWQEIEAVSQGLLLEKQGQLDDAVTAYAAVNDSPKATGRLALLEFKRGHLDQAKSWAYIHADDPTSEYVLAEVAFRAKAYVVAQRHVGSALGQLQKALASSPEYMPVYYSEMPDLIALRAKLQPLLPKPPPKPKAPAPAATPPAPAPAPPAPTRAAPPDSP